MSDNEFNLGILIGSIAAGLSVLSALAALYLWAVNRARPKFDNLADAHSHVVLSWLSPLLLPSLIIMGLGIIAGLAKAVEEKSWPEPNIAAMLWAEFMILMFWLKIRKQSTSANTKEEQ